MAANRLHPVGIGSYSYSLLEISIFKRGVGVPVPTPSSVPVQFGFVVFLPPPPPISQVNFMRGVQNLYVELGGGRNNDETKLKWGRARTPTPC